eukprot:gnl/TRDRNA2_/TRDRNA2_125683_c0_seq1.p1 gnl/TRDRNA2_/TRDRNA2_125683_c0~~gnl/TRDRNA2_/TRDRNA2_125683_c0_seq1.p1  ORF type:complete len:127 (-),score=27.42 gnl/TRDRNA2_/TRDRNA2_125683_c0_seq1:471-800(-)
MVSNNTAVHEVFDSIGASWDSLFEKKQYLNVFEQDGISCDDMMESREILRSVSAEYIEFASWESSLFRTDAAGAIINDRAIENDEQQAIAEELLALGDGTMLIEGTMGP